MGEWAIPGGKLRWGETLQQGAEREIFEECGVTIRAGHPIYIFEHISQAEGLPFHYVVIDLEAKYLSGVPAAGDDAVAAAWIPFSQLLNLRLNSVTRKALFELYPHTLK